MSNVEWFKKPCACPMHISVFGPQANESCTLLKCRLARRSAPHAPTHAGVCTPQCQNGGNCTTANTCNCTGTGFTGPACADAIVGEGHAGLQSWYVCCWQCLRLEDSWAAWNSVHESNRLPADGGARGYLNREW